MVSMRSEKPICGQIGNSPYNGVPYSSSYICALGKPHMCSIPSLRSLPNVAFKTVPMLVYFTMAFSRPLKEDRIAFPLSFVYFGDPIITVSDNKTM